FDERRRDGFVHVETLQTDADLSGIGECGQYAPRHGLAEIGVWLADRARVVAELECDPLQAGDLKNACAHWRAARKRDLGRHGMRHEALTGCWTVTVDQFEDVWRQSGLRQDLAEQNGCQWR